MIRCTTYVADNAMSTLRQKIKGFTLLEILLVLAIASSLVVLMLNFTTQRSDELRRDKTVLQMQQILNAGMSFYLNNSFWPLKSASITSTLCDTTTWTDLSALKTPANYIPTNLTTNAYGNNYEINCNTASNGGGFYVYTTANTPNNARIIAGRLPMAYITTPASRSGAMPPVQPATCLAAPYTGCTAVVANVNIPGQNLNNARSVNFAAVYYSGSCVPAPNCPPNMKPDIMVMPASVSGVNDPVSCSGPGTSPPYDPKGCTGNIYPVSSFMAFARGDTNGNPVDPNGAAGSGPPLDCRVTSTPVAQRCWATYADPVLGTTFFPSASGVKYWRVCLTVSTQKGIVYPTLGTPYTQQGKMMGSIVAMTRCVPNSGNENPAGSMNVWQQQPISGDAFVP